MIHFKERIFKKSLAIISIVPIPRFNTNYIINNNKTSYNLLLHISQLNDLEFKKGFSEAY